MHDIHGNLRGDTLRSAALHAVTIAAVIAVGTGLALRGPSPAAPVAPSPGGTDEAAGELARQDAPTAGADAAAPEPEPEAPPPQVAVTADIVEAQLAEALSGELPEADEAALREAAQAWLREHTARLDLESMTPEQLAEATEQMRRQALEAMAQRVRDMARATLAEELQALLDAQIHPQMASRIEAEMQGRIGEEIRKRLLEELREERRKRFDEAIAQVEKLRRELNDARAQIERAREDARHARFDPAAKRRDDVAATLEQTLQRGAGELAAMTATAPQVAEAIASATQALDPSAVTEEVAQAQQPIEAKDKDAAVARLEEARVALQAGVDRLQTLRGALGEARNSREPDPLSQEATVRLLPELREMLAKSLAEQPLDAAAQRVTEEVLAAMRERAARFGIEEAQLRELVAELVRQRMAQNMEDQAPQIDAAFAAVRAELGLRTPEEIAAAQQAAAEARQGLESLRDAQAAVATDDPAQREAAAAQQRAVTERYDAVAEQVDAATEAARAVSRTTRDRVNRVTRAMTVAEAPGRLAALPDAIEGSDTQAATQLRDGLVQQWSQGVEALREVETTLAAEHAEARAATARIAAAPSEERVAALREGMTADVQAVAGEMLPGVIQDAGDIDVRGLQGLDARLAGMGDLLGRLDQLALNAAEGRPGGGMDVMSLGLAGLGGSEYGSGLFDPRVSMFNYTVIEQFGNELRDRANPDVYYADVAETSGVATVATRIDESMLPAMVYFPPDAAPAAPAAEAVERKVPEPAFKTLAFAAAPMMEKPITIDGDLSDWGELRHPVPTRYEDNGDPAKDTTNVYFRWSPEGLYIAYTTKKAGPIVPNDISGWQGDCLEVWLDMDNTRVKLMRESATSHQFFLMPFGYRGDKSQTAAEVGRGQRSLQNMVMYVLPEDHGRAAAKVEPGVGYTVEGFIGRRALSRPNLYPGAYLAMNYSLNRGVGSTNWQQWASPKAHGTWDKPDTWGDLLLLGSDGGARFTDVHDSEQPAGPLAPGGAVGLEVRDKDMDLNPRKRDLLPAMVAAGRGESGGVLVILEETTPDSGVFRASINTQPFAAPPKPNTLNVRGGQTIRLIYTDARAEYGEQNRIVTATLQVGTPVHKLASQ